MVYWSYPSSWWEVPVFIHLDQLTLYRDNVGFGEVVHSCCSSVLDFNRSDESGRSHNQTLHPFQNFVLCERAKDLHNSIIIGTNTFLYMIECILWKPSTLNRYTSFAEWLFCNTIVFSYLQLLFGIISSYLLLLVGFWNINLSFVECEFLCNNTCFLL